MQLPANLDYGAARPLWDCLMGLRGQPLTLQAADVERMGAPCLQVLLAGKAVWARDGASFQIEAPSPAFVTAAAIMGFDHQLEEVGA
jgi:chemotaxis protein CheX